MAAGAVGPRQSDRQRRRYFDSLAARCPELTFRWGNTFSRWRDVPGTELVVAHYITNRSVGVFIRGQRGVPCRDTAAVLPAFSLETALGVPLGDPAFPFGTRYRFDPFEERAWPASHHWLLAIGERYVAALAYVVGGLE